MMKRHRHGVLLFSFLFLFLLLPDATQARLILDLEVRGAYDTNVVGLLSDAQAGPMVMPKITAAGFGFGSGSGSGGPSYVGSSETSQDDFSVTAYAALGAYTDITRNASIYIKGSIDHKSYSTFGEFDSTISMLTAGMNASLSRLLTLSLSGSGAIKQFEDPARDSTAVLGNVSLKHWPAERVWLKAGYEYEQNEADDPAFTYDGHAGLFWCGIAIVRSAELQFGYEYLFREYEDPSVSEVTDMTAHTFSGGIVKKLRTSWYLDFFIDHQRSSSNLPGTAASGTTFSAGVRFSL